jgi:rifampin ADP-ribosylating transferase
MQFDQNNKIVQLCAEGMNMEGRGEHEQAKKLFQQAWDESISDLEKFISAHYVARHQNNVADKLKWDQTALQFALKINGENIEEVFPSLYLNIGKCYEDLKETDLALSNYKSALAFSKFLPENGYGKMIKTGINNGIARAQKSQTDS